tara:strand:- start:123 stop:473 length:351 start_codon:yes stop_codon:yes gene_type:complete
MPETLTFILIEVTKSEIRFMSKKNSKVISKNNKFKKSENVSNLFKYFLDYYKLNFYKISHVFYNININNNIIRRNFLTFIKTVNLLKKVIIIEISKEDLKKYKKKLNNNYKSISNV